MIVAIDGPAAAGKGTIARRLAVQFNLAYLDTGGLYRAVALSLLRQGVTLEQIRKNQAVAIEAARSLSLALLGDPDLRREQVGNFASEVAQIPELRQALLDYQRDFAHHPPASKKGAILDGRDIGTVVCPNATVKIFVTASAFIRAKRRAKELEDQNSKVDFEAIHRDVLARDARDEARSEAPLKPAADAHLLDTSDLDIEAAFIKAADFVKAGLESQ